MRGIRTVVLIAGILVVLPAGLAAQKSLCGPAAEFQGQLGFLSRMLTGADSAAAAFRQRLHLPAIDTAAKREVVTTPRDCNRLLRATGIKLRTIYGSDPGPLDAFEFAFFRMGDYFVALQVVDPDPAVVVSGKAELLVFRAKDLGFVARIMS